MRLVYHFPHSMPVNWPEDWRERTFLVEDGDEEQLYIDYQDKQFVRPMAPWSADALRAEYQGQQDDQRKHSERSIQSASSRSTLESRKESSRT